MVSDQDLRNSKIKGWAEGEDPSKETETKWPEKQEANQRVWCHRRQQGVPGGSGQWCESPMWTRKGK